MLKAKGKRGRAAVWRAALLVAAGCWFLIPLDADASTARPPGAVDAVAGGIYGRATNVLEIAALFKPRGTNEEDLSFKLAPFIFEERASTAAGGPRQESFGRLVLTNASVAVDTEHPAVYFSAFTPVLNGQPHAQLAFTWFYSSARCPSNSPCPAQGVRLTLNSAGEPAIWEVLADNSGRELIFVSQKLESAAAAQWGQVLPGRRHAIERGTNEAPGIVVARVIDDAPVPMGPMVYLDQASTSAISVSCRCMPVQARKLEQTTTYDLLPLELTKAVQESGFSSALWPGNAATERKLERSLRLPARF